MSIQKWPEPERKTGKEMKDKKSETTKDLIKEIIKVLLNEF